jgi:hypothetical protein
MNKQQVESALLLVGWKQNARYTSEDNAMIEDICEEILNLNNSNSLDLKAKEEYSLKIYNIVSFQFCNIQERADMISNSYINSEKFIPIISILDEAYLCFYRGYYTASLSLLFIALEKYLRQLYGWNPGNPDPTFYVLKNSVRSLPETEYANIAYDIIEIIYSRYDSLNPTAFYFNRHGLLHGVERTSEFDEMNCARLFNLFDILCCAEGVNRTAWGDNLEMFNNRYNVYEKCRKNHMESILLSINFSL